MKKIFILIIVFIFTLTLSSCEFGYCPHHDTGEGVCTECRRKIDTSALPIDSVITKLRLKRAYEIGEPDPYIISDYDSFRREFPHYMVDHIKIEDASEFKNLHESIGPEFFEDSSIVFVHITTGLTGLTAIKSIYYLKFGAMNLINLYIDVQLPDSGSDYGESMIFLIKFSKEYADKVNKIYINTEMPRYGG